MLNSKSSFERSMMSQYIQSHKVVGPLVPKQIFEGFAPYIYPYKNEKVAAMLKLGCSYFAAIRYVCNNKLPQSSPLERLVACLQPACSFYQLLLAHRAASSSQLQLAAVTITSSSF